MSRTRLLGALIQGMVLGTLLFVALTRLMTILGGSEAFIYQGF